MAIGDQMPIYQNMVDTYIEDFSNGMGKFVNTKHAWNRETFANQETQYYPDQNDLNAADRTVFINASNQLVLRTIPTPGYMADIAKVVINGYMIESQPSSNVIRVRGINYYDRDLKQNRIGIGPKRDAAGIIKVHNTQLNYSSIVDLSESSTESLHEITLTSAAPSGLLFDNPNCRATLYKRQPYLSGIATTQNTPATGNAGFAQKFGRFGFRLRAGSGTGHFPAAWLWPDYVQSEGLYESVDKGSEKDVWEILGHAPDHSYTTLHQPHYDMRPNGVPRLANYNGVEQWKKNHQQQFQHYGIGQKSPNFSDGFYWVYMDWYSNNTFAWYFEQTPNSGNIIEVANSRGAPPYVNGKADESMLLLNNAIDSSWAVSTAVWDTNSPHYTNTRSFPIDFIISDVTVQQFDGQVVDPGDPDPPPTTPSDPQDPSPTKPIYTGETVVGPPGDISDVIICLPTEETDRQGTIHEIEAKLCYRPSNIPADKIGLLWDHDFPAPFDVYFIDGSDKNWRARIHLTTTDTTPLPTTLQGRVTVGVTELP